MHCVTLGLGHTWIGAHLGPLGLGPTRIGTHLEWVTLGLGHTWIVMTSVAFVASLGTRGPTIYCVYGIGIDWPGWQRLTDDSLLVGRCVKRGSSGTGKRCLTGTRRL